MEWGFAPVDIYGWGIAEELVIDSRIGVKAHSPDASMRQTNLVETKSTTRQIKDDDNVVAGASAFPAMEGYDFINVVLVEDVHVRTT